MHIHELVLPEGVVALGEPDQVVVTVLGIQAGSEARRRRRRRRGSSLISNC
jgi:hypothetical protein